MPVLIAPPPNAVITARITPAADAAVAAALAIGGQLVDRATAVGLAFTLEELEAIDIPDSMSARVDRAQLRSLASIYLAADLEPAGIIAAVEQMAGLSSTGSLTLDFGSAAPLVENWWRHRRDRMSADERNAFFAQLFGTSSGPAVADHGRNQRFEDRMLELCEALAQLDQAGGAAGYGSTMGQARVRNAARALAQNLGDASTGMAAFVASEVIATLRDAFAILGHSEIRGAFHARDIWDVVRAISRLSHGNYVEPQPFVQRGKAGMLLLAWLADALEKVLGSGVVVELGDPAIGAAIDWLQATLSIGEVAAQLSAPPITANPAGSAASVWSSLAR
jgi:hypothetical protein